MLDERKSKEATETEQYWLGALLVNNEVYDLAELSPDDFDDFLHQEIFRISEELISDGRKADAMTIKGQLPEVYEMMEVGPYLVRLMGSAPSIISTPDYAKRIKENVTLRRIEVLARETLEDHGTSGEVMSHLEDGLSLIHQGMGNRVKSMVELIDDSIKELENIHSGVVAGLSTGIEYLDKIIGGLHGSKFYIVAGRPAMGKSTLASQIAMNVVRQGKAALFFNLEMGSKEMLKRIYSEMIYTGIVENDINYTQMDKSFSDDQLARICRASNDLKQLPLMIDDTPNLSLMKLKTKSRAYIRQFERKNIEIGAIFVDYLQLMNAGSAYRGNRVQEISELTRGLKLLAKELDLPIVALSQLSRGVEARDDKRPMLSDLRESGSIEQDADVVMFTYRPEYYLEKEEPRENTPKHIEWQAELARSRNMMQAIVSKQRNGPTGTAYLTCSLGNAKVKD